MTSLESALAASLQALEQGQFVERSKLPLDVHLNTIHAVLARVCREPFSLEEQGARERKLEEMETNQ